MKWLRLKIKSVRVLKKLGGIFLAAMLIAVSFNALVVPYGLMSGGVSGIALIIKHLTGFPLQAGIFLLNIPVFIWGYREIEDKSFLIYSAIGLLVLVIALPALKPFIPVPKLDLFLASIFSGLLSGLGVGTIVKSGASGGGLDIISIIMKKKYATSFGTFNLGFNTLIIVFSLFFFDLKIALYTLISMYASSKVCDMVVDGFNKHKSVTIISDRSNEIAQRILQELNRGVTFIEGQGAYSGKHKTVISCVVSHWEMAKLNELVLDEDGRAFIYATETVEVMGKGFKRAGVV